MVRRRQYRRAVRREDVRNFERLSNRARRDLQRACGDDQIAFPCGFAQNRKLVTHRMGSEQTQLLRGWPLWLSRHRSAGELLQIWSYRNTCQTEGLDPVLEIGSHTQPGIVSQRSQLECERQDGLYIATRANRGKQCFHLPCHVTER
jgi:hypothetical protein